MFPLFYGSLGYTLLIGLLSTHVLEQFKLYTTAEKLRSRSDYLWWPRKCWIFQQLLRCQSINNIIHIFSSLYFITELWKLWNITAFESVVFKLIPIYLISHEMLQTLCRVVFKSIAIHNCKSILFKCVSIRLENSKYVHFTEAGVKSERSSYRPPLHFHQYWQKIFENMVITSAFWLLFVAMCTQYILMVQRMVIE
jgi:hypothetical protein